MHSKTLSLKQNKTNPQKPLGHFIDIDGLTVSAGELHGDALNIGQIIYTSQTIWSGAFFFFPENLIFLDEAKVNEDEFSKGVVCIALFNIRLNKISFIHVRV